MLTRFLRLRLCDFHCTVILHEQSHLIPDVFAGTSVGHFGVDGLYRLWKVKSKTKHNFIEFYIL